MTKKTTVDTAQKGQTTKKDKTPVGKVTLMKETAARKKAREEQYRNFRINALKRRCERMCMSEEDIEKYVEKLKEQLNAPKEYSILIMLDPNEGALMKEALANAKLQYKYHGDTYVSIDGNQDVLAKLREIAPPSAKIYPYAKKMESVLPKKKEYSGYIAKNTDKSSTAKERHLARKAERLARKLANINAHADNKLHAELQKQMRMNKKRKVKKALKKLHIKLSGIKKKRSNIVVQMKAKKASEAVKTTKKAA